MQKKTQIFTVIVPAPLLMVRSVAAQATVLQMAYANAPVKGVVIFHGSLPAAPEESKGKIGPKVLVLHGHADAWVSSPEVIANFRAKREEAGANWEMNSYGGARHGFANPDADKYGISNLEYNKQVDERSWVRMGEFFGGIFD